MFQIGLVVLCAVFVVGYIFFTAAAEREEPAGVMEEKAGGASDSDAA